MLTTVKVWSVETAPWGYFPFPITMGGRFYTPSHFYTHNIKFSPFHTHTKKIKNFFASQKCTKKDPEAFGLWISNISYS